MFEYKLQRSWEKYQEDFGLGRISLFVSFFNLFIFLYSLLFYGEMKLLFLVPILLTFLFSFFEGTIISLSDKVKLILNIAFLAFIIPFNYGLTGVIDELGQGLYRYDEVFSRFDQMILGAPIANLIQDFMGDSTLATLYYDWIQTSYMFFYFFPFYGVFVYYARLEKSKKYKIGRMFSSIGIFFCLNYFLYLVVPVSGPQFHIPSSFTTDLPFSSWGLFLNSLVRNGQPTYIDCFPSGHFGISLLVTLWFHRMKTRHFYVSLFMTTSIMLATVSLRYHYTLDLICAIPLVLFCYKVSRIIIPVPVYRRKK
ncbi:hypothetical protein A9Q84_12820 [Halobacteriovorax marinus]|uniref:Inositolphosphotransferase Aur1/Ipt1 domain-containing protein n=1 Tax=Halobacteriovorax marinus TaxID=97084 RepID=A0A1Y5F8K1_9BACT|nr:hypothetical protein A9Q84_12820 [Halobacteriovorax marinus]